MRGPWTEGIGPDGPVSPTLQRTAPPAAALPGALSAARHLVPPRRSGVPSFVWLVPLLAACHAGPEPATPADFARFQEWEATVDRGVHRARSPDRTCPERGAGATEACRASEALCARARGTDDLDARARCRAAERACRGSRAEVARACPEPAEAAR